MPADPPSRQSPHRPSTNRLPSCSQMSCGRWILPPLWIPSDSVRSWVNSSIDAELFIQRYGGTVDKFTGDGIMALFGAPIALEDHAIRACIAALEIQKEVATLANDVQHRDGVALSLRIGLNSGDVVVGQIGSSPSSYTAIGAQVGMAQRMEAAAPPGGVMLSEATARLVEQAAVLEDPQMVTIKGASEPVPARRLQAMAHRQMLAARIESTLVGRDREIESPRPQSSTGRSMEKAARSVSPHPPALGTAAFVAS